MKIPEKAPEWTELLRDNWKKIFEGGNTDILNDFIEHVEQRHGYLYWDKFKYLDMPGLFSSELVWAYLKLTRQSKRRKTILYTKQKDFFVYSIPDIILQKLSFVDKFAGGHLLVADASMHKSEEKKYIINSLMEEAIASSRLEGAATTRKIAKEMLRSGRKPKNYAEKMIYNNFKTIMMIRELTKEPLSEKLILQLHESMTKDTMEDASACGRFRVATDDAICVRDNEGNMLYEPPRHEDVSDMVKVLCQYANDASNTQFTHPVIKAINLHFYLSYIHPFMDGNGRTARALFYWYMLKNKYWIFQFLPISRIFLKAPARYAKAFLYTEIDGSELTYFIYFNLRIVEIALNALFKYLERKQVESKQITHLLTRHPELNQRQKVLVKHALDNPNTQYTIATHQNCHRVTYETARRDLMYLTKKQFLIKTKKGRKFYYVPHNQLRKHVSKK
ncbi:MAG: Fic family protein [Candidatus Omnitrophica bacterium]|nr:Fic family protein [Candidatus Omnitrophota bacterium]